MFYSDISQSGLARVLCEDSWCEDDTRAALEAAQTNGDVLIVDISRFTLPNGFSLVAASVDIHYSDIVVVCGTLENRIKVELLIRLVALPYHVIPVMRFEEVDVILAGLGWSESATSIQ